MATIECRTQVELDAALLKKDARIELHGDASFYFRIGGSAKVEARESSHVEAWESSHVEARESSHVVAWGSSHVEAWGSSHVVARESSHVVAWGSSHVEAWGHAFVRALSAYCKIKAAVSVAVMLHVGAKADGGTKIKAVPPKTAAAWCSFHGVEVNKGVAILYKAVRADFKSQHHCYYSPGSVPIAPDWDGGKEECGGGLHFSPSPSGAKSFDPQATRYLACPVKLSEMRKPQAGDSYPEKIKAKGCAAPVWEVDLYGNPVAAVELSKARGE